MTVFVPALTDMIVKRALAIANKRVQNLTLENTELKCENIEQNKQLINKKKRRRL